MTHPETNVTLSDILSVIRSRALGEQAERSERVDGRAERTAATRRGILSATRALILEGVTDPTAREIATRTGITTRTLFRHFADMQALHLSLVEDADIGAAAVMDEPFPTAAGDRWPRLVEVLVDRRARVYESLLPLYISTIWSRYRAAVTNVRRRRGVIRRRQRLRALLPDEIAADVPLFEALDGVLSIEYWVSLRRDQGLSVARATEVLHLAVTRLTR